MTQQLVEFVLEQTTVPLDRWAVAATLESGGIRDVDAREKFGRRDVFDLADEVYALCLAAEPSPAGPPAAEPVPRRELVARYLRGGFFFLQLALQLGSLTVLGYGQWASLDFSGRQASVVGVALIASFLLTGPATQVIGHLGPYFAESGKHLLSARAAAGGVLLGLSTLLAGALVLAALNVALGSYDNRSLGVGLVYFALVGCVALTGALLYMLQQFTAMALATVCGIATVGIVLHQTALGIYAAHWTGLAVSISIEAIWAWVVLRRRLRGSTAEARTAIAPPRAHLVRVVAPYALYGAGYFALLFVDRLAAWSAGSHALPFQFRGSYEAGLDWALISVVPALALLEVTIFAFSARLGELGERHDATSAPEHNAELLRFYRRHLSYVALSLFVGVATTFSALLAAGHFHWTKVSSLFTEPITLDVYLLGLAGYILLVYALFNGLFLFSVGRPDLVLRALGPAIAVAAGLAFVLSTTVVYWAAAGGLVGGSAVFALLSAYSSRRVLSSIDFHYFAAY
jgi:hypothetical protein